MEHGGNHTQAFTDAAASSEAHSACLDVAKALAAVGVRVLTDDAFFAKVRFFHLLSARRGVAHANSCLSWFCGLLVRYERRSKRIVEGGARKGMESRGRWRGESVRSSGTVCPDGPRTNATVGRYHMHGTYNAVPCVTCRVQGSARIHSRRVCGLPPIDRVYAPLLAPDTQLGSDTHLLSRPNTCVTCCVC